MVDEVVAGECVDDVVLAAQVRGGDGDQLTVACRRRGRRRARQQRVGVGGVQRGRHEHRWVVAAVWWHAATIQSGADTPLTAAGPRA